MRIRAAHDSVRSLLPQVLSVANLDNGLGARGSSGVADRYFTPVSRRSRRISRLTPTYQGGELFAPRYGAAHLLGVTTSHLGVTSARASMRRLRRLLGVTTSHLGVTSARASIRRLRRLLGVTTSHLGVTDSLIRIEQILRAQFHKARERRLPAVDDLRRALAAFEPEPHRVGAPVVIHSTRIDA